MEIRTYCLRQQYVHMRFADDLLNTKGMEGFMAEDKRSLVLSWRVFGWSNENRLAED